MSKLPFFDFFLKSYRLSSVNKTSLKENAIASFRGYQILVYFLYCMGLCGLFVFFFTAYGPLQKLLPQESYFKKSELIELIVLVDSIEKNLDLKSNYIHVLKRALSGATLDSLIYFKEDSSIVFTDLDLSSSKKDSLFRDLVKNDDFYNIPIEDAANYDRLADFVFYKPVDGVLVDSFSVSDGHFGVDVVAGRDASVKSTLDGVVIFSDWSTSSGHTLLIQHVDNIISVYMHNSLVTKKAMIL